MKNKLISAVNLCKSFASNGSQNHVLDMVNVDIYEGDFTIIMGPSGSGKSTLLYSLSGMDTITSGQVFYRDKEINNLKEKDMALLRSKEFGFIFQQTHLVSNLSLLENVTVTGYLNKDRAAKDTKERAEVLLKQMNVIKAKDRMPFQVSGGEAQRAAIARAMINEPGLIFGDEPTGALNKKNTVEVLNLLSELNDNGQSILMVTHDVRAAVHGTRLLYLEDGQIIGEMNMPPYKEEDFKSRETQINAWLTSLEW